MSRFLLLLGQYDFTWVVSAQMTDGTFVNLSNYHAIQFDGTNFGDRIFLGTWPDSSHIIDPVGAHQCASGPHVHNVKFLTNTTYSVDGAASALLPVSTGNSTLRMVFTSNVSITTSKTKFFSYDGNIDAVQLPNIAFKAAEGGVTDTWIDANGLLNALSLADQAASTTHTFYVACSFSPSTLGLKSGKIKLTFNYI